MGEIHLHKHVPVLMRPGAQIQFGVEPAHSLILPIPQGVDPGPVFKALLHSHKGECVAKALREHQVEKGFVTALAEDLSRAGLTQEPSRRLPHLTIIGRDALRFRLYDDLRTDVTNAPISARGANQLTRRWLADEDTRKIGTVVLTGMEVPQLPLLQLLWARRIPHVTALFRDGALVCGLYCQPPYGPCPMCVEVHRRDFDPAREVLALQLRNKVPDIPGHWLGASVALVGNQLRSGDIRYLRGIEVRVDFDEPTVQRTTYTSHPRCPVCGTSH